MIRITPDIAIAEDEIEERFVRAAGPGGQNVNKVASAVQLRFDAAGSPSLPEPVRARLKRLAGRRMTEEGVLVIEARRFRTQEQNRRDARARLAALLRAAATPPRLRKPTRPPKSAARDRLAAKRRRAAVKGTRAPPRDDD